MRHPRALLCLALVAAAAGLAAGQNLTAAKRAAGQPALDAAVSAAKAVGGAKYAAYTAVNDATRPAKAAAASIINAKFQAPSALARAKLVAAGDAASAAVDAKAAVAKPILQKVVSKVAPALSAANDAADSVKDATYGAAKTAVGSLLASKINATSEQVDRLVAAKLSKVMPFVNKYGGEVNAKVEQIANADDAAMAALLKAPSDKFVGLYEATVTEGNPIRTATYPIHQVVDEALDTLNRVQDGPVKQALAPLHSKVSAGLEKLAIRLEGPVAKQVAAPRAAIRGVVAKVSDFVDGPGYNISAPVRTVVNHAIMGVANFVEGNHSEWQAEPTPGAGRFVNDIGNFVGNNLMVPGVGRVASAMFGIIPKPTPRNPNLPGRPTDPVYPRALPTNPKNEPSGGCFALARACFVVVWARECAAPARAVALVFGRWPVAAQPAALTARKGACSGHTAPITPLRPPHAPLPHHHRPPGTCKPWAPPEGYRNVLDYCKAMQVGGGGASKPGLKSSVLRALGVRLPSRGRRQAAAGHPLCPAGCATD